MSDQTLTHTLNGSVEQSMFRGWPNFNTEVVACALNHSGSVRGGLVQEAARNLNTSLLAVQKEMRVNPDAVPSITCANDAALFSYVWYIISDKIESHHRWCANRVVDTMLGMQKY